LGAGIDFIRWDDLLFQAARQRTAAILPACLGSITVRLEVRVRNATVGRAPTAVGQPVDGARRARLCVNTRDCLMQSRRSWSAFQSGYFHATPLTGFKIANLTRNESCERQTEFVFTHPEIQPKNDSKGACQFGADSGLKICLPRSWAGHRTRLMNRETSVCLWSTGLSQ
jgi:hypothetical protein